MTVDTHHAGKNAKKELKQKINDEETNSMENINNVINKFYLSKSVLY